MTDSLYYPGNSRSPEQTADMVALEAAGICIFCPDHIRDRKVVVHESRYWFVTTNDFPYTGTIRHLLISPKEHVTDLLFLPQEALLEYWEVLRWARDTSGRDDYGRISRNGPCEFTGATIRHVHEHVTVSDPESDSPVMAYLSSKPSAG